MRLTSPTPPELDRAIATHKSRYPSDTFTTTYHPFQLDPSAPTTSIDKRADFASRVGAERSEMMFPRVAAMGKEVGINFSMGGRTGNTRDSHRVIALAGTKGADTQTKVVGTLFKGYFEEEKDITSHEVLQAAAMQAGIEEKDVKEWFESGKGGEQVDREIAEALKKGITGVPNITLQGKLQLGGAQDSETFLKAFEQVKAVEG